jgi:hypothetical protein
MGEIRMLKTPRGDFQIVPVRPEGGNTGVYFTHICNGEKYNIFTVPRRDVSMPGVCSAFAIAASKDLPEQRVM